MTDIDPKTWLAFAIFVLLTTILAMHHEPWRDEVEGWLMARDLSVSELLQRAGYKGEPILWQIIQAPFARAGAPFTTQRYLHLVIANSAAWLLLFRAPFSFVLRLALVFGYFLSFEYAVVARNYSSGILLCFMALTVDRVRMAPLYGLAIGLAANASAHFTFFAVALLAPLAWDALGPGMERRTWLGIGLALLGIGLAIWQLWPPPDGQLPPDFFARFELFRVRETLSQAFVPRVQGQWTALVGVLAAGWVGARLWSTPRAALVFALCSAALGYVFVFKYASGVHHYGLFFVVIVMALWMAESTPPGPLARRPLLSRRAFTAGMLLLLLPSLAIAARVWRLELSDPFSEAADMARFIRGSHLDQARIAAHQPISSVLALLPRRAFWYPGIGEEGSHMKWDAKYWAGWNMTVTEATARMKLQCPDWQDRHDPVLLLLNKPLPDAETEGFRLLYRTPGRPWGMPDEVFYLYAPAAFAPEAAGPRQQPRRPTCEASAAASHDSYVGGLTPQRRDKAIRWRQ